VRPGSQSSRKAVGLCKDTCSKVQNCTIAPVKCSGTTDGPCGRRQSFTIVYLFFLNFLRCGMIKMIKIACNSRSKELFSLVIYIYLLMFYLLAYFLLAYFY